MANKTLNMIISKYDRLIQFGFFTTTLVHLICVRVCVCALEIGSADKEQGRRQETRRGDIKLPELWNWCLVVLLHEWIRMEKPNWTNINFRGKRLNCDGHGMASECNAEKRWKTKCIWNDFEDRQSHQQHTYDHNVFRMLFHVNVTREMFGEKWIVKYSRLHEKFQTTRKDNKPYMVALDKIYKQQEHERCTSCNNTKFNSIAMEMKLFFSLFSILRCSQRRRRRRHGRLVRSIFKGQRLKVCVCFLHHSIFIPSPSETVCM